MHIVVETWTPKQAWLDLTLDERQTFLDGVKAAVGQLEAAGITTLGWGRVDQTAEHSTSHDWVAVWQATTAEGAAAFLDGVEHSGWYDLFDQTVTVGELKPVNMAVAHLAMAHS